jgi:hypothetical protein
MTAERKGPVIFGIPGTDDASAAAAVSRIGGFTERDKEIALEIAVRGPVSDAWRPPPTASMDGMKSAFGFRAQHRLGPDAAL